MRLKSLALVIVLAVLVVASSNCVCRDLIIPPDRYWHNYSYDPSPNVTIGLLIHTNGPDPVTILDSGSDKIIFSAYTYDEPAMFNTVNDSRQMIYYRLMGRSDMISGVKVDTILYLPRGPNYTVTVNNDAIYKKESNVTNNYSGGNLTLLVNEFPGHLIPYNWETNWSSYG